MGEGMNLLTILRFLQFYTHNAHNLLRGPTFFQDHEFLGELYPAYEVDYDAGMHFDKLRRRFPEMVLIGNVSCDLLCRGTFDQVVHRTRECIDAAGPRVIAASSNSILHGTPVDNVYALFDTAKSYKPAARTVRA